MLAGFHYVFDWFKSRFKLTCAAETDRANCPGGGQQDYCVMMQLCNPSRHRIASCGDLQ